ncbi:SDR family NAD(P)-dependent oxidoreductase [Deinococcus humi]|uniref:NAD(P)-dependent dehydrogenase (Short-subunit alcohol dehydrogenase family) n=1 Tax=Deinococcus humi TaxID=662880 RepID=A0A7W8NEQ8_9DEIO|nr:SDR family oxidoreductase [Deinococcus humi]MBB5364619.1 NAD(P)-dependent dehydrogenase (short-subunit alcohol dehydrogenase family) [Deinococcus humi]GGO39136.1 3-oxoacyl-ACP reductase [Deinococcus humi]
MGNGEFIFVTGGGSGIGRAFALHFSGLGYGVAVADLNGQAAETTAQDIRTAGGQALSFALDVSDFAATQSVAAQVLDAFGQVDVVFANAGVLSPADYFDVQPADWDLSLDVNVKGVAYTCRAFIPSMMARKQGRILTTASYNGFRAGAHVIPYRVTKAAVVMYTRCLALLLAESGITVNAICPGVTLTPMQLEYAEKTAGERGITREAYLAERTAKIPMHELTTVEDLNALAEFLASKGSRLITGQAIAVDGGVLVSS